MAVYPDSTFDRELLAIYLAIKHFRHFVEGREFYIATDHKPLTFPSQLPPTSTRHVKYATSTTSPNSQPISVTLQGTTIQSPTPFPAMPCVPSMQHNRQLSISRCWQRLRKPTQNSGPCKTPRPPSKHLIPDLIRYISTLSVPFHLHMDTSTCSRASTVSPAGLRPSRCQT